MKAILIISFLIFNSVMQTVNAGEQWVGDGESFAQEYSTLRHLLQQVQSKESALIYKSEISKELDRLRSSQISGGQAFATLSVEDKKLFIKKFQNNQFHCGEVTQVMEERRRILLDPELSEILSSVVIDIP